MSFKSVVSAVLLSVFTFGFSFAKSPKIALVLSGGGAKGFAEIPLLEALENEGIRPDIVLGTSMGALIGSLYAAGYTPKQIRQTLLSMDFMTILNERPSTPEKIPMSLPNLTPLIMSIASLSETKKLLFAKASERSA